jgi:hypothetical protein
MLSADAFENLLSIVRTCVAAGRAELIEPSLIDRLHVGEVQARIEADKAKPAATLAPATPRHRSLFGEPTPEMWAMLREATNRRLYPERTAQPDTLAEAVERRFRSYGRAG